MKKTLEQIVRDYADRNDLSLTDATIQATANTLENYLLHNSLIGDCIDAANDDTM